MDREEAFREAERCTECELCLEKCPTYKLTGRKELSPLGRLRMMREIKGGAEVEGMVEAFYSCTKCMACEVVCPEEIEVSKVVAVGREILVEKGLAPLERGERIIKGIMERGNAVAGDPSKRWDWLPEDFTPQESDRLLYIGCLASYLVKDVARSSFLLMKELGIPFTMWEDEGCCGTYIYEAGERGRAEELFSKNTERFLSAGIKEIVVPCNGCLKCFKYFYPEVLGDFPPRVRHLLEVVHERLKEDPSLLKKLGRAISYHDPCRLSRGEGLIEEPRELFRFCGLEVKEMERRGEDTICCGSGAGVRSLYKGLSQQMAQEVLGMAKGEVLVSTCPFCTFNLRSTSKEMGLGKEVVYFSELILSSLRGEGR